MSSSRSEDANRLAEDAKLSDDDVAAISTQLDEMDASSNVGPWTRRTLELISQQPGVVSSVLARQLQVERYAYRHLVAELSRLGLTYRLDVGYSISPRGRAYLRKLAG